ncbi:enoyl-CoA hydratase/isomerase family protein [Noviherbaspirillum saxi]|uniref:Enoyl-CoA hydratase/isomerase family protein n=1 Tax=Noviherbaspirillum saxi TaxID=2320863 RepID=A0A3A3FGP7_9BURK|nr:enoyl-CoA hydratase-related protein [Noviherbaspirillum saxi]RJF91674.1 enoyl-CoA hydratase/isomerase family protein [Noviherbaspirillum saxi]
MNTLVTTEMVGAVAVVTLNNIKTRNALSRDMLTVLAERLDELGNHPDCRAIVLTGAEGHFCSGGDISGMSAERPLMVGRGRMELGHRVVRAVSGGAKPVIAAVEGYAAGAGLSLAAAADYVVSSTTAKYVSSFAKVGLIPDLGLLWTLPQRIGLSEAKRMFATARVVAAPEALQLGLADKVVEPGALMATALEIAQSYTSGAPLSMALVKAAYEKGLPTFESALRYEVDNQAALYLTADHREAVAAFLEKRPAVFKGV